MNKIKIYSLILVFAYLLIGIGISNAQDTAILSVNGTVSDLNTGNPVGNHLVMVNFSGGGLEFNYQLFTNEFGIYSNDSLLAPIQGEIVASTLDCNNELHQFDSIYTPANSPFIINFEICTDSLSPDCENGFSYETQNNINFTFYGYSYPEAIVYYWDFGDGNYATGELVSHEYTTTINDWVYVTLNTFTIEPNSLDTCFATSVQEIWVGNNGSNCSADFTYTVDSLPTGSYSAQFTDQSTGEPAFWMWDFGDGNVSIEQNPANIYTEAGTYMVCLTIMGDSLNNCYDVYCEEIQIGNGSGTDCDNFFWFETNDNISFNFFGESTPLDADIWFWDFGDGTTGYSQNITHSFNPNIASEYLVELFTLTFDPATGDSCMAISQQWIQVGSQGNCQADFLYEQNDSSSLSFNFIDLSSGNITDWYWDFGDGSYSIEPSPVNFFPGPGNYQTCLIVSHFDLGMMCADTICMEVIVDIAFEANFQIILDTLSGAIRTYQFYDNSTGYPDTWNWQFGDGSTSYLQNPTFQYQESGTYEVCLSISRNFENGINYSDSFCQTIEAPAYYDFGGQVFIDGFPLNNTNGDTTIVDTGIAYLYKKYENALIPIDTNIFYNYGYYWFTQIREGEYIVKTGLTEDSENYANVTTSYHEVAMHWYQANTLSLYDTNFYVNIDMVNMQGLDPGQGSISGFLSINNIDIADELSLHNVEILLLNSQDIPLTFTKTDVSGNFMFTNIPTGSYTLKAEATGYGTYPIIVNLDDNNNSIAGINLELHTPSVGIPKPQPVFSEVGTIYPNPVLENFNLKISVNFYDELHIEIFTIHGQKISSDHFLLSSGEHTLHFNSSKLQKGVYLLSIYNSNNKLLETRKFIK